MTSLPSLTMKVVATGRQWGDKVEGTAKPVSIAGIPMRVREFDAWDGGDGAIGHVQQYYRWTVLEHISPPRDDWQAMIHPSADGWKRRPE